MTNLADVFAPRAVYLTACRRPFSEDIGERENLAEAQLEAALAAWAAELPEPLRLSRRATLVELQGRTTQLCFLSERLHRLERREGRHSVDPRHVRRLVEDGVAAPMCSTLMAGALAVYMANELAAATRTGLPAWSRSSTLGRR